MNSYDQRPTEQIAYRQVITDDKITNSMWSISPTGPTVELNSQSETDTVAMVSGLQAGKKYTLSVLITTESGQIFERQGLIRCQ